MQKLMMVVGLVGLVACGSVDEFSVEEATTDDFGSTSSPVVSTAVDWTFRESIGHSVERELVIAGSVGITLDGPEILLANGGVVQNATVRIVAPSFTNPSALRTYRFLVRFDVTTALDGSKVYRQSPWGNGAIVDKALPNALARFKGSYDPMTNKASLLTALRSGLSMNLAFDADAQGSISLVHDISWLASSFTRDFSKFTVTFTLE